MKLIKPLYSILDQEPGLEGIYKMIELAGRCCYKSEDKITEDSAKKFVDMLIARGHTAMLEHGTVYLKFSTKLDDMDREIHTWFPKGDYSKNPYSKIIKIREKVKPQSKWNLIDEASITHYYITTNYRVLYENNWLDDLQYLCEPTEYHEKRVTVKFITSIGIGRELLRHRILPEDWEDLGKGEPNFSYANESTRYCNYSKNNFNNEVTFVIPSWTNSLKTVVEDINPFELSIREAIFMKSCFESEKDYLSLLKEGAKPEEARDVLSLATKSELVMTGFISDWQNVFLQRVDGVTGNPHPDCKALMEPVKEEFIKRQWIK